MILTISVAELVRPDGSLATLVGFGDIEPHGSIREVAAVECILPEDVRVADAGPGSPFPQGLWVRGSRRPLRPADVLARCAAGMGGFALRPRTIPEQGPKVLTALGDLGYNAGTPEDSCPF